MDAINFEALGIDDIHKDIVTPRLDDSGYSTGASRELKCWSSAAESDYSRHSIISQLEHTPSFPTPPEVTTTSTPYFKQIDPIPFCYTPDKSRPSTPILPQEQDYFKLILRDSPVIDKIISYLSAADVVSMYRVCRSWREAVRSNPYANDLRRNFKENKTLKNENDLNPPSIWSYRNPLANIGNWAVERFNQSPISTNTPQFTAEPLSRHQLFRKAGEKLLACEKLKDCPRCSWPSRITPLENRGHCTKGSCLFDFCTHCTMDYHYNSACPVRCSTNGKIVKKCSIGSDRSKKNLKRL